MMNKIIDAVDKNLLVSELTPEKFLRKTNFGENYIYVCTAHDSPNIMKELGRLREITFRNAGGGTGKDMDIDSYDISEHPYKQLIVWDPVNKEITGGYRFIEMNIFAKEEVKHIRLATQGLFKYSDKFISDYLPYTIELGRSFIQPNFQSGSPTRKTLFALDNLWNGLGALLVKNPGIKYFFGKVTMYTDYDRFARDLILYFMNHHFEDTERLVYPHHPLSYWHEESVLQSYFPTRDYDENIRILSKEVRARGENVPPLINSYMSLSRTMKCFGTATNETFGNVEETGILVKVDDIYESKKKRHIKL
jgi:hypothetical protein